MSINLVVGAYGALSLIAAVLQGFYKNIPAGSAVLMGLGGSLMIAGLFTSGMLAVGLVGVGAILAHISAIINGTKMHGQINKRHHFIRFGLSAFLIVGMLMEQKVW
ncbi:hypothetical protein EZV73_00200 [Acidaminobacter sp. JC074]|uniref:hypothetical protein n=1 Tax=Acidaminobacter sp. JC074 TaxID=2530199 RepID=UPI001F10D022|nr:hypothetical protein [Acidaminobacter sp. JC074]MCH4885959.1 hypothetical protein [Acidaminobacter sp. JC074]